MNYEEKVMVYQQKLSQQGKVLVRVGGYDPDPNSPARVKERLANSPARVKERLANRSESNPSEGSFFGKGDLDENG